MTDAAPAIFVALEQSGFAAAIRQSLWLYPAANVGHIVSLTFFAGAVAVMDIRLLGGLGAASPACLLPRACSFAVVALAGMAGPRRLVVFGPAGHPSPPPAGPLKTAPAARRSFHLPLFLC